MTHPTRTRLGAVIVNAQTAEHYAWGCGCDGWHLVRTPALSVIEERMPAGASEVRHRHLNTRQFFFVLAGELTLEVEHQEYLLHSGDGLEVSPGLAHQALNRSGADVRVLVTSQPPGQGDRIDA